MKQMCNPKIQEEINNIYQNKEKIGLDNAYMLIAHLASFNSNDPHSQTGSVIISKDNEIVSIGWNEMPFPGNFPWIREGEEENTKYPYVVHAERMAIHNAILDNNTEKLTDSNMYVNLFPCNQCMQQVTMYKLKGLYYDSDKYHDATFSKEARIIMKEYKKYKDNFICKQITIDKDKLSEYQNKYSKILQKNK